MHTPVMDALVTLPVQQPTLFWDDMKGAICVNVLPSHESFTTGTILSLEIGGSFD